MLLTKKQQEPYENGKKIGYICKEKFKNKYLEDKEYRKVRDCCHYTRNYWGAVHSICNVEYSVLMKNSYRFS